LHLGSALEAAGLWRLAAGFASARWPQGAATQQADTEGASEKGIAQQHQQMTSNGRHLTNNQQELESLFKNLVF